MLCFFNLAGAIYDPDVVGHELQTLEEVRIQAARYIAEVVRDKPDLI